MASISESMRLLSEALMLMPKSPKIVWESEDEASGEKTKVKLDLSAFVIRSFATVLMDKGYDKDEVTKALEEIHADPEEFPDEKPYSITVSLTGGRRRTKKH